MLEVYRYFTGEGFGAEWYSPETGGWMAWAMCPLEAAAQVMEMAARELEAKAEGAAR